MQATAQSLARVCDRLVAAIGTVTAWTGLVLVLLVSFNVIARYFFSFGTVALQELEWHLMAVLALIGMSYTANQGEAVRVDMLYERYGPRLRAFVDLVAALLMGAIAVIFVKLSIPYVEQSQSLGEGSPDPGGLPHRFLLKAIIPFGFALLALQAFVQLVGAALRLSTSGERLAQQGSNADGL